MCNQRSLECLQSQVYPGAWEGTKGAEEPMSTPIVSVAPTGIWKLDPVHSRVDFEVSYLAGTFKGEFHEIAAELSVEGERASLAGAARVAGVDVRDENL